MSSSAEDISVSSSKRENLGEQQRLRNAQEGASLIPLQGFLGAGKGSLYIILLG